MMFAELLANANIIKVQWGANYDQNMIGNGTDYFPIYNNIKSLVNAQGFVSEHMFRQNREALVDLQYHDSVPDAERPIWRIPTTDDRVRIYRPELARQAGIVASAYTN